jgi:hypothetical protein
MLKLSIDCVPLTGRISGYKSVVSDDDDDDDDDDYNDDDDDNVDDDRGAGMGRIANRPMAA